MPRGGFAHHPSIDYQPSKAAAGITGGLYLLAALSLFTRLVIARSWWGLCLPISALSKLLVIIPRLLWPNSFLFLSVTSTGFFFRIALDSFPNSVGLFTLEQLFIIVTPAAFLAFNYMLYGRFIVNCVDPKHSLIRPDRVARLFVFSDIITFIVQACLCWLFPWLQVAYACVIYRPEVVPCKLLQIRTLTKLATRPFSLASWCSWSHICFSSSYWSTLIIK